MSFNIFDIQARAKLYQSLTPGERALLKFLRSLLTSAMVTGLVAGGFAAQAALLGGQFDPRAILITAGVTALKALVDGFGKYASAKGDPLLEEIAGAATQLTSDVISRAQATGKILPGNNAGAAYANAQATASRYAPIPLIPGAHDPYDTAAVPATNPAQHQAQTQARGFDETFLNDRPTAGLPSLSTVQRNIPPLPPLR